MVGLNQCDIQLMRHFMKDGMMSHDVAMGRLKDKYQSRKDLVEFVMFGEATK